MVHLPPAVGSRDSVAAQQSALLYPPDRPCNVGTLDPGDLGDASHAWEGSAGLVDVQADGMQYRPVGLAQFRARRLGRDPREGRVDGCHGQCSWRSGSRSAKSAPATFGMTTSALRLAACRRCGMSYADNWSAW